MSKDNPILVPAKLHRLMGRGSTADADILCVGVMNRFQTVIFYNHERDIPDVEESRRSSAAVPESGA